MAAFVAFALVGLATAALVPGCYQPSFGECVVACTTSCPDGLVCSHGSCGRAACPGGVWQDMEAVPGGPAIAALALDPSNGANVFVAPATGPLLRSQDGGDRWAVTGVGYAESLGALVVDPFDGRRLWAGNSFGAWGSSDGGANWLRSSSLQTAVTALSSSREAGRFYAGSLAGGYVRVSQSADWSGPSGGLPAGRPVRALVVSPVDAGAVWAALDGAGVYRSRDGGASWRDANDELHADQIGSPAIEALAVDPRARSTVYAGGRDGRVWRTTSGQAWFEASMGLPPGAQITALAIGAARPSTVYAGTNGHGVFVSYDRGEHWVRDDEAGGGPRAVTQLAVDDKDAERVFAGTRDGRVWRRSR